MMKKKLVFSFLLAKTLLFPSQILAQSTQWTGNCVAETDVATIQGLGCLVANAMSVVFSLLGLGGFIMLIISGVKLMLSGGDAQNTRKAAGSIRNIVIGLVLALSSYLIVKLISVFTGIDSILSLNLGS